MVTRDAEVRRQTYTWLELFNEDKVRISAFRLREGMKQHDARLWSRIGTSHR
jgi:hypothetical protein